MRLAAVYIPQGALSHLFGENHTGLTLNLGGRNNYAIHCVEKEIQIKKTSDNKEFINTFWGEKISSISAIVGRNGIGKTSILRAIHTIGDTRKKDVFYLFETNEEHCYYYNELEIKKIASDIELKEIKGNVLNSVKQYYSPIVDADQLNTKSQLSAVSTGEENLKEIYNKQLLQDVKLLNDPILEKLKSVYTDFPVYRELEISVSQHRKFEFKNVYASTNLGSQDRATVLKTYIESDIRDIEDGK